MLRRLAPIFFLLAGLTAAEAAPVISTRPDHVALTIYHDPDHNNRTFSQIETNFIRQFGLALVTETRTVDLPAGPSEIQFRGVAGTMVPQTADITGVAVVERNFDFNLLTPGAVIEKSIGQTVHFIRTDPVTGVATDQAAILRSGPDGAVLQIGNTYEALNCSGLPERIVFDHVPAGLADTPTLTARVNAPKAGRYPITLRYLATGLNWSADYVARVAKDGRSLALTGWITLSNASETSFANAPVDVIAGQVKGADSERPPELPQTTRNAACWPSNINWSSIIRFAKALDAARVAPAPPAGSNVFQTVTVTGTIIKPRDLGDYKLYPLPEPTTVAARQTKQVQFLDQPAVPFTRVYRVDFDGDLESEDIRPATELLRLQNTKKGGLGIPLPAGGILATAALRDGAAVMTGRDSIADTPTGAPVEIKAGTTSNVSAQTKLIAQSKAGKRTRDTLQVTATNAKIVAVTFEWRQTLNRGVTFIAETHPHNAKDGGLVWSLTLKPGETTAFQYTLERP